jgi:GNAT superfamily N-acetyltransferase
MVDIRSATSADAGPLAELRWEFRTGRQPPAEKHDVFVKRCATWMRRELTSAQSWHAWVAVTNGVIVGQVWVHAIHKIPNPVGEPESHAYITNLYVKPSARGGIGTHLLDAAIRWARSNHIERVVLWPSPRSVALYLRHGFSHGGDVMELKL